MKAVAQPDQSLAQQDSLHGETAARRQAITELLFFASVGDLHRCKKLVTSWGLDVKDARCCDYDRRTPLCVWVVQCTHWGLLNHSLTSLPS